MLFKIEKVMPVRLFHKRSHSHGEGYARERTSKNVDEWVQLQRKMWRLEEIIGILQHPSQTITVGGVEIPLDKEAQFALSRVYARQLRDIRKEFSDF